MRLPAATLVDGQSIPDACIGLDDLPTMLQTLADAVKAGRRGLGSVGRSSGYRSLARPCADPLIATPRPVSYAAGTWTLDSLSEGIACWNQGPYHFASRQRSDGRRDRYDQSVRHDEPTG